MLGLTVASLVITAAYTLYAVHVCGVPASLSETYYLLEKRNRPKRLFQLAMISAGASLLPAWLEASSANVQFLAFLSCGSLLFVGAAPLFRSGLDRRVHVGATVVAGLSASAWCISSGYGPLSAIMLAGAAGMMLHHHGKALFWLEMAAFAMTYLSVMAEVIQAGF